MNTAAVVSKLSGQAFAVRDGQEIALAEGSELLVSDAVRTGDGARLEVRFADETEVSLGPLTQIEIRDFAYDPGAAVEPAFAVHIMEGFARTVSGGVVKQNPDAFKLSSPMGTAGIRGTTIESVISSKEELWSVVDMAEGHNVIFVTRDGSFFRVVEAQGESVRFTVGDNGFNLEPLTSEQVQEILQKAAEDAAGSEGRDAPSSSETSDGGSSIIIVGLEQDLQQLAGLDFGGALTILEIDEDIYDEFLEDLGIFERLENEIIVTGDEDGGGGGGDEGGWSGVRVGYSASGWTSTEYVDELYIHRPEVGINGSTGVTLSAGPGSDRVIFFGDNTVLGGYGSSDTITCVGDMTGGVIYGDEQIVSNVAALDNDLIIVRGSLAANAWDETDEQLQSTDPATFAYATLNASVYGDADTMTGSGGGNDSILVYGGVGSSGAIYGDAYAMTGSSGGNDVISVLSASDMANFAGAIYGDAYSMDNTSSGGNDTISVMMSGGDIYGDARTLTSTGGNDSITVSGEMSGGNIYGDAYSVSGNAAACGNDRIVVSDMTGGVIYGDAYSVGFAVCGSDTIIVSGEMSGGTIYGDAAGYSSVYVYGDDSISVGVMSNGSIDSGGGNDTIQIGLADGSSVNIFAGAGADLVVLKGIADGAVASIDLGSDSDADRLDLSGLAGLSSGQSAGITLSNFNGNLGDNVVLGNGWSVDNYDSGGGILTLTHTSGGELKISNAYNYQEVSVP